MTYRINAHKLETLHETSANYVNPDVLRREGKMFLIGGNLPVYSTLETMYDSYCQESSDLFHVAFGAVEQFEHNLEMVRQIKHNFSIRIMGSISYPLTAAQVERVYLGGLDILNIALNAHEGMQCHGCGSERDVWQEAVSAARAVFSRWSVVSSIAFEHHQLQAVRDNITELLAKGVIPLLKPAGEGRLISFEESTELYSFLAAQWHACRVPLKPIEPLLRLTTPFEFAESSGFVRGVFDKIQDRRTLAASDLRRHLRTSGAEASFESAGL